MPSSKRGPLAIACPSVFDGENLLQNHCVLVQGDTVTDVLPTDSCPPEIDLLQLHHGTLAPGLIDLQVNGGGDVMFQTASNEASVNHAVAAHRALGTTAMLPTVLSDTREQQQSAVTRIDQARTAGNAGILGVHIEGPFFNRDKRGAHQENRIREPQEQDLAWLCALDTGVLMVTLAPEAVADDTIGRLSSNGVKVCAGHSAATYQQMAAACEQGLQGITHLFNAMSPPTAREPSITGAALECDQLWAGIIADGHHVHPACLRLAQRLKPAGKLVLVSDAMASVGGEKKHFELYGEDIREIEGRLVNADGVLAGSAISLMDAVRYSHQELGLTLAECLRMASRYPAAILGLDNSLGSIAGGFRADLVHFDEKFTVHNTWLAGAHRRHNKGDAREHDF